MTPAQRHGLRRAQQQPPVRDLVLTGIVVMLTVVFLTVAAQARWKPEYASAPANVQQWFKDQHNAQGQWCCDESDGARFDGAYQFDEDGSVTLFVDGGKRKLPAYMVLKGPNPTGHAVWWHVGETDYCFAPGILS